MQANNEDEARKFAVVAIMAYLAIWLGIAMLCAVFFISILIVFGSFLIITGLLLILLLFYNARR